jgi:hypothetical protein
MVLEDEYIEGKKAEEKKKEKEELEKLREQGIKTRMTQDESIAYMRERAAKKKEDLSVAFE